VIQMEIPRQLQVEGIRFVLLEREGKKPFQKEWQNKNIFFNDAELIAHINAGKNYGVLGGGTKQLVIVDFDNEKVQDEICLKLPRTFTVKTGSGKLHKYFFSDKTDSFKIFDEQMNTLADVQGDGKQVVGAGSIHPNGNNYEVVDDFEISFINYSELKALLFPYDKKPQKEKKVFEKPKVELQDDFLELVKNTLSMEEVLNSFGINTATNPTQCPFHSSKGGKCLGFTREVAHCFHCDGSWNIFSLVKDVKKYDFKKALEYLASLSGLEKELEISKQKYLEKIRALQQTEERDVKDTYLTLMKDKKWGDATEVLVDWVKKNNYIYTTKNDTKTEMWFYRDGIYTSQGKSEVKEVLRILLGNWYSNWICGKVLEKLEPDTYVDANEFFNKTYIDELPVQNGILNIRTREVKPFTPEKVFFNKLPVEYNKDADCPQIEKFLKDVLAFEEDIDVFYEIGGFCLLKEYKFEKAFMFVGNGRNGKDKTEELLKRLFGVENCCSIPLSSLVPNSFIISELWNKMVNIAGEVTNQDLKDTSEFKSLTGRSLKSAPRKFLNPVTFVNYAKFIFACNELPMVYDNSKGFWDRWTLLEFPYTFVPQKELDETKDKINLKLRDEGIIEKITTKGEMSGLLNKFLNGLELLSLKRTFSSTKGCEEVKQLWIRKSNSVMAFALDFVEDYYDGFISKKDFRKRYTDFCKKHKIIPKSDYVIRRTLEELFGASEGNKETFGGKWERVWDGVRWKNNG